MAGRNRKRSPALFEVIRNGGGSGTAAPAAVAVEERKPFRFRLPKLSFSRRVTSPGFPVVDAAPAMADFAPAPRFEMPDIRPSLADPTLGRGPVMSSSSVRRRRSSGVHFGYDADRQEVSLKMRYTTAVVSAFSVLVLIGLAYVTGRHGARAPGVLAAVSTEKLKKGPAQPTVLNVGRSADGSGTRTALASVNGGAPTVTAERQAKANAGAANKPTTNQQGASQPASTRPNSGGGVVDDNAQRAINLNYVIVQSYPERKSADEAAALLNKAGIRCTVEPAPSGFNRNWVSVIGTTGFQRTNSSSEFNAYIRAIEKVGAQFEGTSKFKKFQPLAYKWRQGA